MSRALLLTVLLAGLIVVGTSTPAWAASLDARINPNNDTSPFKMTYQKTVFIEYPNGGISSKNYKVKNGQLQILLVHLILAFKIL